MLTVRRRHSAGRRRRRQQARRAEAQRVRAYAVVCQARHGPHGPHGRGHELVTHLRAVILGHRVGQVAAGAAHAAGVGAEPVVEGLEEVVDPLLLGPGGQFAVSGLNPVLLHRHRPVDLLFFKNYFFEIFFISQNCLHPTLLFVSKV